MVLSCKHCKECVVKCIFLLYCFVNGKKQSRQNGARKGNYSAMEKSISFFARILSKMLVVFSFWWSPWCLSTLENYYFDEVSFYVRKRFEHSETNDLKLEPANTTCLKTVIFVINLDICRFGVKGAALRIELVSKLTKYQLFNPPRMRQ